MRNIEIPATADLRIPATEQRTLKILPLLLKGGSGYRNACVMDTTTGSVLYNISTSRTANTDSPKQNRTMTTRFEDASGKSVAHIEWRGRIPFMASAMNEDLDIGCFILIRPDIGVSPAQAGSSTKLSRRAWCFPSAAGDTEALWVVKTDAIYYFSDMDRYDVLLREDSRQAWRLTPPATLQVDSSISEEELVQLLVQYLLIDSHRGRLVKLLKRSLKFFPTLPLEEDDDDVTSMSSLGNTMASRLTSTVSKLGRRLRRYTL